MALTFADVVPVQALSSHSYSIDLGDEWCIGNVPNGGYVTSCFLIVARVHSSTTHRSRSEPHPINLHLQFLRKTSPSLATFTVKDVKLGSRITNFHITLSQMEKGKMRDCGEGYVAMSNLDHEVGLTLDTQFVLYPPVLAVDLPMLESRGDDRNWGLRRPQGFSKFRRAGQHIKIHLEKPEKRPKDRPRSIIDQWVRLSPHGRPGKWTNDALGYAVDMFPQIVQSYVNAERGEPDLQERNPKEGSAPRPKYWYPTLSLNLDVKKLLPPEGAEWLFVRVRAKQIKNGRLDMSITVLDADGDIVALSTHSSLVMDADRNTTSRSKL